MADKVISQISVNGETYNVKDSEVREWARADTKPTYTAAEIGSMAIDSASSDGSQADEIVVLSGDKTLETSGETLAGIFSRIDKATVVDTVADREWVVNIINDDGDVDFGQYYTSKSVDKFLDTKVDKVEGKALSDNNFTDELLNKLNGIEDGANNYTYDETKLNNLTDTVSELSDKVDNIVIPDELSDLASDNEHRVVTDAQIATWNSKYSLGAGVEYDELSDYLKNSIKLANTAVQLTSTGHISSSIIPGFYDDVRTYGSKDSFPSTGETGVLYIAEDDNKAYRFNGRGYTQINGGVTLGMTSETAFYGNLGKVAYEHSQITGNPHKTTANDVIGLDTAIANKLGDYAKSSDIADTLTSAKAYTDEKIATIDLSPYAKTETVETELAKKQDVLIAGDNVKIESNTVSVDLSVYAKTTDLSAYAKTSDLGVYATQTYVQDEIQAAVYDVMEASY